jgi:hypothetical protein
MTVSDHLLWIWTCLCWFFLWRTLVCTWSRYGEYPLCIFILHAHGSDNMHHKHIISRYATYTGHVRPLPIVNSASDHEFFVCTWHTRVCGWSRYDEFRRCIFTPYACIPNKMHPMYIVPQLATGVSHSQLLPTTYCANGGSLAIISMSQVTGCMTRMACSHDVPVPYMILWYTICTSGVSDHIRPVIPLIIML